MKDLDFDELDRAVSSVLGTETPKKTSTEREDTPVPADSARNEPTEEAFAPATDETVPVSLREIAAPEPVIVKKPAPTQSSAIHGTTATNSTAPKRPTGRFMDVVHPSSDMKQAPSSSISRHGVSLAPSAEYKKADTVPARPATPVPDTKTEEHDALPDPMEFSGYTPEADEPTTTESPVKVEQPTPAPKSFLAKRMGGPKKAELPAAPQAEKTPFEEDEQALLESPFITGTQVEKRPLGFFSQPEEEADEDTAPEQPLPESQETSVTAPVAPEPAAEEGGSAEETSSDVKSSVEAISPQFDLTSLASEVDETHGPLPEELQKEVLSIESDETGRPEEDDKDEVSIKNEESEKPEEKKLIDTADTTPEQPASLDSELDKLPEQSPPKAVAASVQEPRSFAIGSIAPQYKAKERPQTLEPTGSIYDTDTYHQPLKHPEKKKSGWLSVLLILLIVGLGAAAGAAVYFFVL